MILSTNWMEPAGLASQNAWGFALKNLHEEGFTYKCTRTRYYELARSRDVD
jgi:hypothetical protein